MISDAAILKPAQIVEYTPWWNAHQAGDFSYMEIREDFARNLRKFRRQKGLSQEALAHEAGVDRTYISALERCVYSASITMVEKLAIVLGVEPVDLLQRPPKTGRTKVKPT